jgi:hypothetical protein
MALTYDERLALFEEEVPEDFCRRVAEGLSRIYQDANVATADLPLHLQRYMEPHLRRTNAELLLLTSGTAAGIESRVAHNASRDGHAVCLTKHLVITISKSGSPRIAPRWAVHRTAYSIFRSLSQMRLRLWPGEHEPDPIPMPDVELVYVQIIHGPSRQNRHDLGFAYANFVAPGGRRYFGAGINLLERYGAAAQPASDEPLAPEPTITPRTEKKTAQEQTG